MPKQYVLLQKHKEKQSWLLLILFAYTTDEQNIMTLSIFEMMMFLKLIFSCFDLQLVRLTKQIYMGNNVCCKNFQNNEVLAERVETDPSPLKAMKHTESKIVDVPQLSTEVEQILSSINPFSKQIEKLGSAQYHKINDQVFYGQLNENGLPSGWGRIFKKDGSVYTGELENGQANGKGVVIFPDGSYYEGSMKNNMGDGDNNYFKSKDLEYRGGFSQNVFHGIGFEIGKEFQFKGDYKNGLRTLGILSWKDQNGEYKYEGHFDANGKFTGKGKLSDPNGEFEGDFIQGVKDGFGIYRYKSQIRYEGYYKNDLKNGRGTIKNCDETIAFCGQFLNGLPHGKGYCTNKRGEKRSLEWNEGVYADLL